MRRTPLRASRRQREATPPEWTANLGPCAVCGSTVNVQSHHIVERQTLRIHGLTAFLWDIRNRLPLCERDHARHTTRVQPVPRDLLPAAVWEFAADVGLVWWLEKHYTVEAQVA